MSTTIGIERVGMWTYARLVQDEIERKTRRWIICADDGEVELGEVKWLGKWRCYCFFPLNDTLYEKQCLRDLANFCERKTTEHKTGARDEH